MTTTASCGRLVTESAHRVRPTGGIVAPEGGGQVVPTLGGGYGVGLAQRHTAGKGPAR
jgi:hypothetical protein